MKFKNIEDEYQKYLITYKFWNPSACGMFGFISIVVAIFVDTSKLSNLFSFKKYLVNYKL